MRGPENKSTSSLLRGAGKFFRIVGITTFVLIMLAIVLIVIPIERDMKTRNQINARVQAAATISNALVRFRNENGFWPHDNAEFSQNDVEVLGDGLVRVYFRAPESIDGKWADIEISIKNGRYYRSCRAPGIKSGRLPAWCREGARVEEVRLK
jgi:hypothetical protein